MSRKLNAWGLAVLLVALVVTLGCGGSPEDDAAAAAAEREAALAELQEQKAELDAARQELEQLQSQVAAAETGEDAEAATGESAEGEAAEGEAAVEDPQARLNQLESQVMQQTEDFNSALIAFLGGEEMLEGVDPSAAQKSALRMKSDEDMLIAREYIEKGGNYQRAIEIYQSALMLDPENEELQAALAEAEGNRYMSEERFAQVEEGMTEAEVEATLGTPLHANRRDFPKDGVKAWFYPTSPGGSAAAVWFRERRGVMTVYKTDYEKPEEAAAEGAEGDAAAPAES